MKNVIELVPVEPKKVKREDKEIRKMIKMVNEHHDLMLAQRIDEEMQREERVYFILNCILNTAILLGILFGVIAAAYAIGAVI